MNAPKRPRGSLTCGRRFLLSIGSYGRDLDGAFFWLLVVFLITVLTFVSLRERHVELDASQVAEYERRSQFLSNSTVYIVETLRPERLLSRLSAQDWGKISGEIDMVAFVYDDLPLFLSEDWVKLAEDGMFGQERGERVRRGIGLGMFGCGCVLPNEYFKRVGVRLGGYECVLLPGWVLEVEDVIWVGGAREWGDGVCRRRWQMLSGRVVERFEEELKEIKQVLRKIEEEMERELEGEGEGKGEGAVEAKSEVDDAKLQQAQQR